MRLTVSYWSDLLQIMLQTAGPAMPKIAFNDSNISAINVTKTTWFTDSSKRAVRGLRLMAGSTTKSWYLNKRIDGKVRDLNVIFDANKVAVTVDPLTNDDTVTPQPAAGR